MSAILFARDPGLLHLFDERPTRQPDDFALGCRIPNPMLGKRLRSVWAYILGDTTMKVSELPELLNRANGSVDEHRQLRDASDDNTLCHGFRAGFVGGSTAGGPGLGSLRTSRRSDGVLRVARSRVLMG
jgi:hypothetical protein